MLNQALPESLKEILVWAVPAIELFTAALLLFNKTKLGGTLLSLFLLISFTIYIALVQFNFLSRIPCSCGGVIGSLSWEQHFVFNMLFILLAATAILSNNEASYTNSFNKILFANDQEKPKTWNRVGEHLIQLL